MTFFGCASDGGRPDPKAERPANTSTATETQLTSEIPLSSSEETNIRHQVEQNWNLGELAGAPNLVDMVVELRIELLRDGTITKVELMNDQPGNPEFRQVAESAIRATMISSPLKLPPGKIYPAMHLRFHPDQMVQ